MDGQQPSLSMQDSTPVSSFPDVKLKQLRHLDIESIIHEQPVYHISLDGKIDELCAELYVSMRDIKRSLAFRINGSETMTQITSILDFRMLKHLVKDRFTANRTFSINMHLKNVLSDEFDALILDSQPQNLFIELAYSEILRSIDDFRTTVTKLSHYGIRIIIDHVPLEVFPYLFIPLDEIEFVKIVWDASFETTTRLGDLTAQADQLPQVICCRCSNQENVQTLLAHGITYCQGFGVTEHARAVVPEVLLKKNLIKKDLHPRTPFYKQKKPVLTPEEHEDSYKLKRKVEQLQRELAPVRRVLFQGGIKAWVLKTILGV
ncbi:MAG: hypothetical protein FD149_1536 [Rhodospirillaceae bacterium]|nr:MAG: hypothetical protein FD149_1536 [Rhodospirillaceae bacterium]